MVKTAVTITHEDALEARPIAHLVQEAGNFSSQIYLEMEHGKINVKSIMGMMSLRLENGDEIVVSAEGVDEKEAVQKVATFFKNL